MTHQLPRSGTLLHVGCGPLRIDSTPFGSLGWREIRLDVDPDAAPDLIGSMISMPSVPSGCVDAVFSAHNIEHLEAHAVPMALEEFRRVLRPGGLVVITCPDLDAIAARILSHGLTMPAYQSPMGPITPLDKLYGHRQELARGKAFMAHRTGFNEAALKATLEAAGFAQVMAMSRPSCFDLWALATVQEWPENNVVDAALTLLPLLPEA
jgi:SAM-dependent methyltransferase